MGQYSVGSMGASLALGRETTVYRGSHRHPSWPPEVWKIIPPAERKRLSPEFFQDLQQRLESSPNPGSAGADADYWVLAGTVLERVHVCARKALFDPSTAPDMPADIRVLDNSRSTVMLFDDGSFARRDDVSWRHKGVARQPTKHKWRGYTIFSVEGVPTAAPGPRCGV